MVSYCGIMAVGFGWHQSSVFCIHNRKLSMHGTARGFSGWHRGRVSRHSLVAYCQVGLNPADPWIMNHDPRACRPRIYLIPQKAGWTWQAISQYAFICGTRRRIMRCYTAMERSEVQPLDVWEARRKLFQRWRKTNKSRLHFHVTINHSRMLTKKRKRTIQK